MNKLYINRSSEFKLLYLILIFSIVLLLLVAALVNAKFSETARNFKKVKQGNVVINDIHYIENTLTVTGASVRSYLIMRDVPKYTGLQAFHNELLKHIIDLRNQLQSNPAQIKIVDSLQENIESRFAIWNIMISVPADSLQKIDKGMMLQLSLLMRHSAAECSEMRNYENGLMESYIHEAESGVKMTGVMALLATLLCVSVIIFALFKLNGEVRNGMMMQSELKLKVQALDKSNADLERFAYVASHDLHEPLRKLYAFSEILIDREKNLSPDGLDIIRRMHTFVTRMQRLIDDMLEFSLNFNKVEKTSVDLNQIVKNVTTNLAVNISRSNATIDVGALPAQVIGVESQLNQLFQNIISNSIKYAREGVPPHIQIRSAIVIGSEIEGVHVDDEKKKFHKIIFTDNGIGFDEKYREKIFVIFQRLHGKSEYEGTGIGLATCKRVVENHNGYISATGRENEGAEFTVYFPIS